FAPGLAGQIKLTGVELDITDSVTINGPGANQLTVSGNNTSRVFHVFPATVSISGLTIAGGLANRPGGRIFNDGNLTLTDCVLSGNKALGQGGGGAPIPAGTPGGSPGTVNGLGGGVYNTGTLTVRDSTFSGNVAQGGKGGSNSSFGSGGGGGGVGGGGAPLYHGGPPGPSGATPFGDPAGGGGGGRPPPPAGGRRRGGGRPPG